MRLLDLWQELAAIKGRDQFKEVRIVTPDGDIGELLSVEEFAHAVELTATLDAPELSFERVAKFCQDRGEVIVDEELCLPALDELRRQLPDWEVVDLCGLWTAVLAESKVTE